MTLPDDSPTFDQIVIPELLAVTITTGAGDGGGTRVQSAAPQPPADTAPKTNAMTAFMKLVNGERRLW